MRQNKFGSRSQTEDAWNSRSGKRSKIGNEKKERKKTFEVGPKIKQETRFWQT